MPTLSAAPSSTIHGKPSPPSKKSADFASGFWSRIRPKTVGKCPLRPWQTGAMSNRSGRQALDVIPCCSGPAPLTIDPKLGKVTVGITPRACRLNADSCWNDRKLGGAEDRRTLAPSPSTPQIITDLTLGRGCAKADAANIAHITRRIRRYFATLGLIFDDV